MSVFPTTLDNLSEVTPVGNLSLGAQGHSALHREIHAILNDLEAKLGVDASAVTTSHDYKLSAITGVNRAVGRTEIATLLGKTIDGDDNTIQDLTLSTLKTILADASKFVVRDAAGAVVSAKAVPVGDVVGTTDQQIQVLPRLDRPVVGDFTFAGHNHTTAREGGRLPSEAIRSIDQRVTPIYNSFMFNVYRSAALSPADGSVILFDKKNFDVGANVDVVTNKGRVTITMDGFYQINALIGFNATTINQGVGIFLMKNGSFYKRGGDAVQMYNGATAEARYGGAWFEQFVAGDYLEIGCSNNAGLAMQVGAAENFFSGYLVSVGESQTQIAAPTAEVPQYIPSRRRDRRHIHPTFTTGRLT